MRIAPCLYIVVIHTILEPYIATTTSIKIKVDTHMANNVPMFAMVIFVKGNEYDCVIDKAAYFAVTSP